LAFEHVGKFHDGTRRRRTLIVLEKLKERLLKILLVLLVFIASFTSGCASGPQVEISLSVPASISSPIISANVESSTPTISATSPSSTPSPAVTPLPSVVSAGGMGISGLVEANDITPGGSGTTEIPLKNTSGNPIEVSIYYKSPDSTRSGYASLGDSAKDWVTVEPADVTVQPNDTEWIEVTLHIPGDVSLPSDRMEFWLTYEFQPGGNLGYQISQRWLLTTKG
jgi:hypothetical protein